VLSRSFSSFTRLAHGGPVTAVFNRIQRPMSVITELNALTTSVFIMRLECILNVRICCNDCCSVLHPVQMVLGFIAVVLAYIAFVVASDHQVQLRKFKRQHPGLSVLAILAVGYILVCIFGSIIVFLFGIALPIFGMRLVFTARFMI